jgi:hypothetical protein
MWVRYAGDIEPLDDCSDDRSDSSTNHHSPNTGADDRSGGEAGDDGVRLRAVTCHARLDGRSHGAHDARRYLLDHCHLLVRTEH